MLYTSATILDSNAGLVALAQVSYMLGLAMALIWAARSSPSTKGSSILRVQAHMKFKSHLKIITKIYQQYFKHYVQINLNIFQPTITNKLWKIFPPMYYEDISTQMYLRVNEKYAP